MFLQSVSLVSGDYGQKDVFLVGRNSDRESVAVRIRDFRPSFLVANVPEEISGIELMDDLNDAFGKKKITRVKRESLVNLIGFSHNAKRDCFRLFVRNCGDLKSLRSFFSDSELTVSGKTFSAAVYHLDWDPEQQVLHHFDILLGDFVELEKIEYPETRRSYCTHEYETRSVFTRPSETRDLWLCAAVSVYGDAAEVSVWWDDMTPVVNRRRVPLRSLWTEVPELTDVDVFLFEKDTLFVLAELPEARLSRFKDQTRTWTIPGTDRKLLFMTGRERMQISGVLRSMNANPPLDTFSLEAAMTHPGIVRQVLTTEELKKNDRVTWILALEKDNNFVLSRRSMMRASSTSFTKVCEGGQQRKVWNTLIRSFYKQKILVNRDAASAVIVRRPRSSFPDPQDLPNVPLRDRRKKKRKRSFDLFGKPLMTKEEEKKEKNRQQRAKNAKQFKGGYVTEPVAGFYSRPEEGTVTLDFKSMYPSIVVGYRLCYMAVVTDPRWLSDPRAEVLYIPVGGGDCYALMKSYDNRPVRTVIPEVMADVMELRTRSKKKMKAAKKAGDAFRAMCLNFQQLSCKVFQNSIYGFFGVRKNSLLGYPLLMAGICAIGQYMIKTVTYECLLRKAFVVYGDTDSVMVQFPDVSPETAAAEIFRRAEEISNRCNDIFPAPNELEVETLKFSFLLLKRKNYGALELEAGKDGWQEKVKLAAKGLGFKKRDRCPWVRRIGARVLSDILYRKPGWVEFTLSEVCKLVAGEVSYPDLAITCFVKEEAEYKNAENLIQAQVCRKMRERGDNMEFERLSYVVLSGPGKLFQRGESLEFAKRKKLKLDFTYYIENQLSKCLVSLLDFHPAQKQKLVSGLMSLVGQSNRMSSGCRSLVHTGSTQ